MNLKTNNMNNKETNQQKQERIEKEKRQGALNMPSLTRDAIDPAQADDIEQHYDENNRMPALSNTAKDPYANYNYVDDWEQETREGGVVENSLPSLSNSQLPSNRRLS